MRETKRRDLSLALLGAGLLVLCRHHEGWGSAFAHAHGANVAFSFAAFFLVRLFRLPLPGGASGTAALTLLLVWAQEGAQALGLYPGVFDPWDLLYDAVGVCAALALHLLTGERGVRAST